MLNVKKDLKKNLYDITHYEGSEDVTFCELLEQFYYDNYFESISTLARRFFVRRDMRNNTRHGRKE